MRINAFSLIELIVVILLLGIIFSLVLTTFKYRKDNIEIEDIKELPIYLQKSGIKTDGVFLIYGKNCRQSKILSNKIYIKNSIIVPFDKSFKTYKADNLGKLKEFDYDDMLIDNKERHICFKLNLKKGKFIDKLIVKTVNKYFLFAPFFQEIKTFNSLFDAQKAYFLSDLYPKSRDDYYKK